ncbi:DinB family protein [Streptomyces sp. NRRL B-24720]|uniref:DinB family protein n=1 Tax=Streptomyces sp. NRRL B-24720 TaxID=1476876 RepID=UPI0004C84BEF|nr:DinB family protein [Streptomyces sp. NRRL B-24720]
MTANQFSTSTEREALCGFLDKQRADLLRKVEGVSDKDARTTPTVSSLSLMGLLKHSALWERRWFQVIVAGRTLPGEWPEAEVQDWQDEDFRVDEQDTVKRWTAFFEEQVAISREIVAGLALEAPCKRSDLVDRNLRWVLLHMIEETARHAGHADIIRESIDGGTGI